MLTVQNVVVAGIRSAVHDSAPGTDSDAVVFVHGNPGPMDDWECLVPEVSRFARAVAVDLPGFGRADHPYDFDFSVAGYATHLAGVLDQLNVKRAHLVLHDFGGAFGLTWAAARPERCASITLINTGVLSGYRWHRLAKIWQTPLFGEIFQRVTTAKLMKLVVDRDNPKPMPQSFIDRVMGYADWPHRRAVLKLYRATRNPERAFTFSPAQLARLDRPVCVVWGDKDPYLPVVFAQRQREAFPRAEVHELVGLGHWPFIDDPDAVRAIVLPFLRRAVAEPAEAMHTQP